MDEEIEATPGLADLGENAVERGHVGDIAGQNQLRTDLGGQWFCTFFDRIALIGQSNFRTLAAQGLGNSPSNRAIIRNPHDEAAFACH
jgi:hypothetical protein